MISDQLNEMMRKCYESYAQQKEEVLKQIIPAVCQTDLELAREWCKRHDVRFISWIHTPEIEQLWVDGTMIGQFFFRIVGGNTQVGFTPTHLIEQSDKFTADELEKKMYDPKEWRKESI